MATKRPGLTFSTASKAPAPPIAANEGDRTFLAARIPTPLLRQFKSFTAEQGRKVQDVLEEAMTEYLANHRR
jgi:molybdopterin-guanine dinucleotide biosynthesis protein A